MPLIFRSGVPIALPENYADDARHRQLVDRLNRASRYTEAVAILEEHPDSWLAADVLTGAPWAQRFLNTTARLAQIDTKQAWRGLRALMHVLNGTKIRPGRHRTPTLPLTDTAEILARWRADLDVVWHQDRPALASAVTMLAQTRFPLSRSHRRALVTLTRRKGLRKQDLVLTLASWETGVPVRRLRRPTPDLIYA